MGSCRSRQIEGKFSATDKSKGSFLQQIKMQHNQNARQGSSNSPPGIFFSNERFFFYSFRKSEPPHDAGSRPAIMRIHSGSLSHYIFKMSPIISLSAQ